MYHVWSYTLQENLNTFLKLTQKLVRCNEHIKGTHQVVIILNSLPKEFNNIIDFIAYTRDDITFERIIELVKQKSNELKIFRKFWLN